MKHSDDDICRGGAPAESSFRRELDDFLERSAEATSWRPDRVLKQSDFETTELVWGAPRDGVPGCYVRKTIDASSGAGAAYQELWGRQRQGAPLPCAPRIVECVRGASSLVVVMEYVDGCTVERLAAALGPGPSLVSQVMPALCESVQMLHTGFERPLIHRDLKPSNVIMRHGGAVIIDFGCARTWSPGAEADTTHFLTRCYAPPEQFGFGQTDERTDVYALGKMLYFCLTGEQPPNSCDARACAEKGIDPELSKVVARACAFDPGARYPSAAELGSAIERALAGEPGRLGGALGFAARAMEAPRRWLADIAGLVPGWVGVIWNILVLAMLGVMLWQSVETIVHPAPGDEGRSLGYLLFRNVVYVDSVVTVLAYLLLDRRRLRRRFPVLARRSILRETAYGLVVIAALILSTGLIASILGW